MSTLFDMPDTTALRDRAKKLGLHGLIARWRDLEREPWIQTVLDCEEEEQKRRSLERRIRNARLGRFKLLADFDWSWPRRLDRDQVDDLLGLAFIEERQNVVIVGPNGVGKTTIAQNLAHQALLRGYTARFATASELLNDLAAVESGSALARKLRLLGRPQLLVIDEVGYLSYDVRHADLLFEIVSRRHPHRSTIVTTNKPFAEWSQVFPNAGCIVALVDRLLHKAEVVLIDADSYRLKESQEHAARRTAERARRGRRAK